MTEYQFVTFRKPLNEYVHPDPGGVYFNPINFGGSDPELSERMDGWEVVSFQVTPMGEEVLLSLLMRTIVNPETLLGK